MRLFPPCSSAPRTGACWTPTPAARSLLPPSARCGRMAGRSCWRRCAAATARTRRCSCAILTRRGSRRSRLDDQPVVVVHLRDPRSSPIVRDLAERVRLYEAVLTTGPIFVHVYDRDMNSRWSTASLRPELGYEPQQPMSAEENYAFVHPDDVPDAAHGPAPDRDGEPPPPRRIRVRDAEGEWRWLALLSVDLLDDPDVGSDRRPLVGRHRRGRARGGDRGGPAAAGRADRHARRGRRRRSTTG